MISVGIDVSKEKSMVCMLRPYGEIICSPYEFNHTEAELCKIVERIQSFDEDIRVVLEATGAYHLPVVSYLKQAGLFVSVINPLMMKKYSTLNMRKGKTDKMDSLKIASYGIDNWYKLKNYNPSAQVYEELRLLGRQYTHYMTMKIQSKLGLYHLLDRTMPGIKGLLSSVGRDKLSDFVEQYLHYDNIISMGQNHFVEDYCKWAKEKGYHASRAKAESIFQVASSGIPTLLSSSAPTKMLTLEAVRILKEISRTLDAILSQMHEIASELPEYGMVRDMAGVGEILSVRLIAEIGDVRRFHSGSALVAYAGIDSPPYESGKYVGTKRSISKRGSALLRKTGYELMQCIKSTKPQNDPVYLFMLKKESEGKPKRVAKIAALNKFLRIYYAKVKNLANSA